MRSNGNPDSQHDRIIIPEEQTSVVGEAATITRRLRNNGENENPLDVYLGAAADHASGSGSPGGNSNNQKTSRTPWKYWWVFLSLGMANSSDASEILCLSYLLAQPKFQEMGPAIKSLLAAAVFGGMLLGGLVVGALGDRLGRKSMLLKGLGLTAVCGLLSSLTPNAELLTLLRFFSGLGIGATVPPLFALTSELAPPQHRGYWVTVVAAHWMVGSVFVAIMGWWLLGRAEGSVPVNGDGNVGEADGDEQTPTSEWRWFLAVCAVPSALGWFLVSHMVPESPRFLAMNGDTEQAARVAQKLAWSLGYRVGPLEAADLDAHYASSRTQSNHGNNSWKSLLLTFTMQARQLYTPELTQTTGPLQALWFSLSFGSYGLMTWINTLFVQVNLKNVYGNALLFSLSNLPGNAISAVLMDRVGRVKILVVSVILAAASLLVFAYVAAVDSRPDSEDRLPKYWIVGAACGFQCFTIVAWNAIDVLTSEMFPTDVRSTGLGICTASGRVGAMLAQLVNGHLVNSPARLLSVAAGTLVFGAFTPIMMPSDMTGQAMVDSSSVPQEQIRSVHGQYSDHLPLGDSPTHSMEVTTESSLV